MRLLVQETCPTSKECMGSGFRLFKSPTSGELRVAQCRRCSKTVPIGRPLSPAEAHYFQTLTGTVPGGHRA